MPQPRRNPPALAIAVAALSVELTAGAIPVDFRLIPAGEFRAWDGRPSECAAWVMTPEDGARIIAATSARESALVIDYEHGTLHAKKTGSKSPAAGWFKTLEWRDDGLWAIGVDWTALAAQEIADKTYRYVSPLFSYDKATGRVQSLVNAALTNHPGLDGLTDLAALAADLFLDPSPMEVNAVNEELLEQLRWLLNLPVGTTAEEIADHLQKLIAQLKTSDTAAASFDLAARLADQTSQIAALSAQVDAPDPARFVPVATLVALQGEHATLQGQLAALSAEVNGGKLDQIVADAKAAGKLTPATEAWARDLGKSNLAALSAFIAAAPVVVKPNATQSDDKTVSGGLAVLSADAKKVCELLGGPEAEYQETLSASA